jgi:Ca2+-binding RTX toxin-like protein
LADSTAGSLYDLNGGTNLDGTPNSGAESSEVLVGTKNNDLIYAQGGDDTVYGAEGNDTIYGGFGIDRLYGGDGSDTIYGGDNPDLMDGGSGDDFLYGESSGSDINGNDQVIGGSGNDFISGGTGIDKLSGGTGDDHIMGDQDTDPFTHGSDGNDWVEGNSGGDILYGDNGDDVLEGGADQDQMFGGNGDDIIRPGDVTGALTIGTDEVLGGDGVTDEGNTPGTIGFDIVDFSDNAVRPGGVDFDLSLQQNPAVNVNGIPKQIAAFQLEGVVGSAGNDTITGDDPDATVGAVVYGNNWLIGGSGADTLTGAGGNDIIIGGHIRLDHLVGKYNSTYDHNNANGGSTAALQLQDAQYQGASHRVLYSATIDTTGLIDAANLAGGAQFEKHFTELLRSDQFKNTVLGDATGTDGGDTVMFSSDLANYTIQTIVGSTGETALKIAGNVGTAAEADGTDLVIGVDNFNFNGTVYTLAQLTPTAPVITSDGGTATAALSIPENGLAVTTVTATDVNGGLLQYAFAGGADAGKFNINASTGAITFKVAPNFESPGSAAGTNVYDVIVKVTDPTNLFDTQTLAVTVTNVNEAPLVSLAPTTVSIAENSAATTVLSTATVTDPDGNTLVITLSGADAALFSINASGQITFNNSPDFESAHGPAYAVDVVATDNGVPVLSASQHLTVNVTNVNDVATTLPLIGDLTPTAGQALSVSLPVDPDGALSAVTYQWASSNNGGTTWAPIAGATASTFTPTDVAANGVDTYNGQQIHVTVNYTAGGFASSAVSGATGPTGENWTATSAGGTHTGTTGDDIITGGSGTLNFLGTQTGGNDVLNGGAGDDLITYNVSLGNYLVILSKLTSGMDTIDGGANGTAAGDRFTLNGLAGTAETFSIYSNTDDWDNNSSNGIQSSARHAGFTSTSAIVVARNGTMIAGLTNVEEITINGSAISVPVIPANAGGDTIQVIGNFNLTGLNFNTVTVNGGADNDTVDISGLTSDHRIVFNSGAGTDNVIGTVRTQDVINAGVTVAPDPVTVPVPPTEEDHTTPPPPVPVVDLTLIGDDTVNLLTGADGNDVAMGHGADDMISTGAGNDFVDAGSGDDTVISGSGDDMVYGRDGIDNILAGDGKDMIDGGNGNDNAFGGAGDDTFVAHANDGADSYYGDGGTDTLDMSAVMANIEVNLGTGSAGWAKVGGVSDQLYSIENIVTGAGDDHITASGAHNVIDIGSGHDTVIFRSASDADHDTILNFEAGDKIDVTGFMSGSVTLVNGASAAAGQIAVSFADIGSDNFTVLHGHDANDNVFEIDIKGHHVLTGTDFAA